MTYSLIHLYQNNLLTLKHVKYFDKNHTSILQIIPQHILIITSHHFKLINYKTDDWKIARSCNANESGNEPFSF